MKKWVEGIIALTELAMLTAFCLFYVTMVKTGDKGVIPWIVVTGLASLSGAILLQKLEGKE